MAIVSIYPSSDDVSIRKESFGGGWNESTLGDGTTGTAIDVNTNVTLQVRCDNISGSGFLDARAYLYFDTSIIPQSSFVYSATLSLRMPDNRVINAGANEFSDTRVWPLQIVEGTFPTGTLSTGYFGSTIRSNLMAIGSSPYLIGGGLYGIDITFTNIGRSRINKSGLTKIVVLGNLDLNNGSQPASSSLNRAFEFYSQNNATVSNRPLLTIDYRFPPYHVSQMV